MGDMGIVLDGLGEQEFVQPLERIMDYSTSHTGKVVDFAAHAAYAAGLLNDAGPLHIAQEFHPFHRQDTCIWALAEYGKHMLLKRADGANRSSFSPSLAFHRIPLARKVLERGVGGLDLGGTDGTFGR